MCINRCELLFQFISYVCVKQRVCTTLEVFFKTESEIDIWKTINRLILYINYSCFFLYKHIKSICWNDWKSGLFYNLNANTLSLSNSNYEIDQNKNGWFNKNRISVIGPFLDAARVFFFAKAKGGMSLLYLFQSNFFYSQHSFRLQ